MRVQNASSFGWQISSGDAAMAVVRGGGRSRSDTGTDDALMDYIGTSVQLQYNESRREQEREERE